MSTADKTLRLDRTQLNQRRPDPRSRNLVLAMAAGLLAAGLAFYVINHAAPPPAAPVAVPKVQVVVALHDIPVRTMITSEMVGLRPFDKSEVPSNALLALNNAEGKYTTDVIASGSKITSDHLVEKSIGGGLSEGIPAHLRGLTIPVDPVVGVGGWVKPGDHVDVVATFDRDGEVLTRTVLQDVTIMATGASVLPTKASDQTPGVLNNGQAAPGAPEGRVPTPVEVGNVTVQVTPEDAQKLIMVASRTRFVLLLRPKDETGKKDIAVLNDTVIFGPHKKPIQPIVVKTPAPIVVTPPTHSLPPIPVIPPQPMINIFRGGAASMQAVPSGY